MGEKADGIIQMENAELLCHNWYFCTRGEHWFARGPLMFGAMATAGAKGWINKHMEINKGRIWGSSACSCCPQVKVLLSREREE